MDELIQEGSIKYRWWRSDRLEIPENHIEALKETALERIHKMSLEGYHSGQLIDQIRMNDEDGEEGIEYEGWWEVK